MHDFGFERSYWGDCTNTFDEEQKHYVYARCMGLPVHHFKIPVNNQRILDVGGGPVSMLLKTTELAEGLVWDPISYPDWTLKRYAAKNIRVKIAPGELLDETSWDEVWIYNCLQHVESPAEILRRCVRAGKVLRIFEWIDIPPHEGHPNMLTQELLDKILGTAGKVSIFNNENGCTGKAYSAVVNCW